MGGLHLGPAQMLLDIDVRATLLLVDLVVQLLGREQRRMGPPHRLIQTELVPPGHRAAPPRSPTVVWQGCASIIAHAVRFGRCRRARALPAVALVKPRLRGLTSSSPSTPRSSLGSSWSCGHRPRPRSPPRRGGGVRAAPARSGPGGLRLPRGLHLLVVGGVAAHVAAITLAVVA